MEKEKMTKESRDELLERILEETARNPYKRSAKTTNRTSTVKREVKPVEKQPEPQVQVQQPKPIASQPVVEKEIPKQEEPKAIERTQVFEGPEINAINKSFDISGNGSVEMMSAAEKIQKIKQEKAAAAKAAIMRKAEIDNSRMMQNSGSLDMSQPSVFAADDDEKVNIVMPEDEYLCGEYDEEDIENAESVSVIKRIMNITNYAICIFVIIFVLFNYIFCIAGVSGDSMMPTLIDGDKVLTLQTAYTPHRGDVVVIDNQTAALFDEEGNLTEKDALNCMISKRIIAVGGDIIDFDFEKGIVIVNSEIIEENYIGEPTTRNEGAFEYPLTIPEGYVFVLGDNRNISKDSRHGDIGLVPEDEVVGKVVLKVYPLGRIGGID